MNLSTYQDNLSEAFTKNFITFALGLFINSINGALVYTYFKNQVFHRDPRYTLYIHLVINDMAIVTLAVLLQILTYTVRLRFITCCILVFAGATTNKISPLNLAGMALERYIAVCHPLQHGQICTVQRAYALIALIWVFSLIPPLTDIFIVVAVQPLSIYTRRVLCFMALVFSTPYHKTNSLVFQVLFLSFVFLTVLLTYLKVLCVARAASGSNRDSARNARNTILLHGVQLLLCMMSYTSPLINSMLLGTRSHDRINILFGSFLCTNVLPRLLSPLIYGLRDNKFRTHLGLHRRTKGRSSNSGRLRLKLRLRLRLRARLRPQKG